MSYVRLNPTYDATVTGPDQIISLRMKCINHNSTRYGHSLLIIFTETGISLYDNDMPSGQRWVWQNH